jgi:hypothetical protein
MLVERSSVNKKLKEREALASRIERTGFEMFPCSSCEKGNTKCIVLDKENSSRCSECVLRGAKCDAKGILVGEWRSLELETDCLEREMESAFAVLRSAQQTALESAARIERLKKQERFLKSKGKDMVRRRLKTMDKLNEVKEKEKQREAKQTAQAVMLSSGPRPDALAPRAKSNPFASLGVPLLLPEV